MQASPLLVERLQTRLEIDRVRMLLMIAEALLFYRVALASVVGDVRRVPAAEAA
jgi:hypothetical protein